MASNTTDATYWVIGIPNWAASGSALRNRNKSANEQANEAKLTRRALDMKTQRFSDNFDFRIPLLRVGTLDTLMSLSDDLGKVDQSIEVLVKKIRRTYGELKGRDAELSVSGTSAHQYVERWEWDAATLPPAAALKDLASQLSNEALSCDDELKKKLSKYTEVSTVVTAIERKEGGTLLVKPLGGMIKPSDIIEGEYLTTLLVVVPKNKEQEFLSTYEILEDMAKADAEARRQEEEKQAHQRAIDAGEKAPAVQAKPKEVKKSQLHKQMEDAVAEAEAATKEASKRSNAEVAELIAKAEVLKAQVEEEEKEAQAAILRKKREATVKNIVPRSARKVAEDPEFVIYRIIVFKKGADTIRTLCREKRYTVRAYEHDPNHERSEQDRKNVLMAEKNKLLGQLVLWLESQYTQMFKAWIHIKAIRTFVEAVLRFGIPVNFQAVILRPKKGLGSKLRSTLSEMYNSLAGGALSGSEEDTSSSSLTGGEFYPYVYMSIDLSDE